MCFPPPCMYVSSSGLLLTSMQIAHFLQASNTLNHTLLLTQLVQRQTATMRASTACKWSAWALLATLSAASPAVPKPRCAGKPRTTTSSSTAGYPVYSTLPTSSSTTLSYGAGTCQPASTVTISAGTCSSPAVVSVTVTAVTTLTETVVHTATMTVTETTASDCVSSPVSSFSASSSSLGSVPSPTASSLASSSLSSASTAPGIICTETSTVDVLETVSTTTTVTPGAVMIITTLTETDIAFATATTTITRSVATNASQPTVTSTVTVVDTASERATTTTTRTVFIAPTITGPTPAFFTPIHSVYPGNNPARLGAAIKRQDESPSCTSTTTELVTTTDQTTLTVTTTAPTPTSTSTVTTTETTTATTTDITTEDPSIITPAPTTTTITTTSLTTITTTVTATTTATDPSLPAESVSGVCAGDNILSSYNGRPITFATSSTGPSITLDGGEASPAACCMACFGSQSCAGWVFNPSPGDFDAACTGFQAQRGGQDCDGALSVGRFRTSPASAGVRKVFVGNSPCGQVTASPLEV
ncbi:PAN domain-containing protein [Microdochium nivale]|nr:PAN domain-containing protein [Microdochium nivale]